MLKKLILTVAIATSFAFAGPCCKVSDSNATRACDTNETIAKCKHKDCKCGENCKCGDSCKCTDKKSCDCNKTGKKAKKMKARACEGNCSK